MKLPYTVLTILFVLSGLAHGNDFTNHSEFEDAGPFWARISDPTQFSCPSNLIADEKNCATQVEVAKSKSVAIYVNYFSGKVLADDDSFVQAKDDFFASGALFIQPSDVKSVDWRETIINNRTGERAIWTIQNYPRGAKILVTGTASSSAQKRLFALSKIQATQDHLGLFIFERTVATFPNGGLFCHTSANGRNSCNEIHQRKQ